uniref:Integrase_H2C2 domain-containing protein n=1 Tax=Strongyloides venezuelensis TaxID=75913 RepID=A0A0K0G3I9_STRVS
MSEKEEIVEMEKFNIISRSNSIEIMPKFVLQICDNDREIKYTTNSNNEKVPQKRFILDCRLINLRIRSILVIEKSTLLNQPLPHKLLQEKDHELQNAFLNSKKYEGYRPIKNPDDITCVEKNNDLIPVIPEDEETINKLLMAAHTYNGHYNKERTTNFLNKKLVMKNLHSRVSSYIESCSPCQRVNASPHRKNNSSNIEFNNLWKCFSIQDLKDITIAKCLEEVFTLHAPQYSEFEHKNRYSSSGKLANSTKTTENNRWKKNSRKTKRKLEPTFEKGKPVKEISKNGHTILIQDKRRNLRSSKIRPASH